MSSYDAARETLREAELTLMQQREAVAVLRRELPPGPLANSYSFDDGTATITLDQLVADRPLIIYHFMFGGPMDQPCPMCSMWADGWNGIVDHLEQSVDFALVTNATAKQNAELAQARGWTNLRWLSAAASPFKVDYGSSDADGNQMPFLTVFERAADGVRLSYSGSAHIAGEHWRGVDLLSPAWHFLDLTRDGRGDFMPSLSYTA